DAFAAVGRGDAPAVGAEGDVEDAVRDVAAAGLGAGGDGPEAESAAGGPGDGGPAVRAERDGREVRNRRLEGAERAAGDRVPGAARRWRRPGYGRSSRSRRWRGACRPG